MPLTILPWLTSLQRPRPPGLFPPHDTGPTCSLRQEQCSARTLLAWLLLGSAMFSLTPRHTSHPQLLSVFCNFIYFVPSVYFFFLINLFREGKGGRKRGRETSMGGCLLHAPYWGPGPQPRHVPWLGIKMETLWFAGGCSIH